MQNAFEVGTKIEVTKSDQSDIKAGAQGTIIDAYGHGDEDGEHIERVEVEWPSGASSFLTVGEDEWKEIDEIRDMGDVQEYVDEELKADEG